MLEEGHITTLGSHFLQKYLYLQKSILRIFILFCQMLSIPQLFHLLVLTIYIK